MGTIEEIKTMQQEGKSDQEIALSLQSRGLSSAESREAISQARIKEAVVYDPSSSDTPMTKPSSQSQQTMEPSMMNSGAPYTPPPEYSAINQDYNELQPQPTQAPPQDYAPPQQEPYVPSQQEQYAPSQEQSQNYAPQQEAPQQFQSSQAYDSYASTGVSSDTISEIVEQVVNEKLSAQRNKIEESIEFKNSAESKLLYFDERLKRIEKIIDRLQLSVLQKVGDYMTNVEDIKRELVETQKSFKSLLQQPPQFSSPKNSKQV